MALSGPKMTQKGLKWPEHIKIANWNYLHSISASLAVILSCHMTSLQQIWVRGLNWPKKAEKGPKRPKIAWMSEKWHPKSSPLVFCFSCNHFEWSHDQFTTILSFGPKLAKNGRKRPQMTKNGPKVWKVTSETISIGFLLLLRSFWVVTWLVCDNFEFGAKMANNGQKWPQMTKNGLNVWKVTEIDWFDVVTALTDQFWVPLLTSSSSEAGPAKNLNFGTLKIFSCTHATDHTSSFSFTQNAEFLRARAKLDDMFFFLQKMSFCPSPYLDILGKIIELPT